MSAHKDGIWRELYPFQSYVRMLDGHRYHYLDEGKGPVLLMVHGNPTWSFYWRNLVLAFRDRFRVVVPDHIGCGLSAKPQDYPYTLGQHVRNLRWLIEQLDLRDVTLLAHDWGGAIGMGAAVAMPQRFGRFILFNTSAFRDTRCPLRIRTCRIPYWGAFSVRALNGFARAALSWATEKPERMTAAVKAGLLAPYDSWANRVAVHRFVQDIPLKRNHASYGTLASIEAGLPQFKRRPVQFIWGMKDWCFTPHFLERFVDEFFPDAEVNPIDDAGHYVVEDAYERIVPLVEDFLVRHGVLKGKSSPVDTWKGPQHPEPEPAAAPDESESSPVAEVPRGGGGIRGTAMAYEMPDDEPEPAPVETAQAPVETMLPQPPRVEPVPPPAPAPADPLPVPPASRPVVAHSRARVSPPSGPLVPPVPIAPIAPPARSEPPAAEVDEYPFPRAKAREVPPPVPRTEEVDEYPFPKLTRTPTPVPPKEPTVAPPPPIMEVSESAPPAAPLTDTSDAIPLPPSSVTPVSDSVPPAGSLSDTSDAIPMAPPAAELRTRDPAVGETRLPDGGFPSTSTTPTGASEFQVSAPPGQLRNPAIGETRLPDDEATPLGAGAPSEAGARVIRDSGLASAAAPVRKSDPPAPAPVAEQPAKHPTPVEPSVKKTPAPASPAGFTPEMVKQQTVLSLRPPGAAPPGAASAITPHDAGARITPREDARSRTPRERAVPIPPVPDDVVNVALRLRRMAAIMPEALAVIAPAARDETGKRVYDRITFSQLDRVSDRLARGLAQMGVVPGTRLALMVPPGIQFVALVFGLFKAGVVSILIDPGMGRKNLLKCLDQARPEGFVGIPLVHQVRRLYFWRFRKARFNVVVGTHKPVAGAITFDQLRGGTWNGHNLAHTKVDDPAAIIFTTGSTGPPKGVLYRHGNFDAQVDQLQEHYRIGVGEVSLSGFPLFTLFDAAMGVTAVIPDMDPTRPAQVDPRNVIEAVTDLRVTQAFASPAMWNRVGKHCEEENVQLPTLRRILSAGAPVPPHVLRRMQGAIAAEGDVHTPYGATEALPVASIGARELLPDLAARSQQGAGTCVGRKFSGIEWRVVRIVDGPIPTIDDAPSLPQGEIGELVVSGAVVTREYFENPKANRWGKIDGGEATRSGRIQGPAFWHRMGDVGYFDAEGRFWYCGRMAHRVQTAQGTLFTEPCEAIFNTHPLVYRSALVGVGKPGKQTPVIILEPHAGQMPAGSARTKFLDEIRELARSNPKTERIEKFLLHPSLPVDIRHNSKIFREKLAKWARWRVW